MPVDKQGATSVEPVDDSAWVEAPATAGADRTLPLLATIAVLAWTGFFVWSLMAATGAGMSAADLPELIARWAVPVLLILAFWLLALRYRSQANSGGAADMTALRGGLAALHGEVSQSLETLAARAGVGAQAIPDRARMDEVIAGFERLGQVSASSGRELAALHERVGEVMASLEAHSDGLHRLAEDRFENLRLHSERFRAELETREQDNLSAIRRRADELSKTLSAQDIAMRTRAGQGMDQLQARVKSLRDGSLRLSGELERIQGDALRGWDKAVADLETRMKETVGKVVEVDENAMANASTRLAALHEEAERIDAAAAGRLRAFEAEIANRRDQAIERGQAAFGELESQITAFDRRMAESRENHLARVSELSQRSEILAARMTEIDDQLAGHVEQCQSASDALGGFVGALSERLAQSRELLDHSGRSMEDMTSAGERLLEAIRTSADVSAETIPAALASAHDRLGAFEQRSLQLRDAFVEAERKGAALVAYVDKAREGIPGSSATLESLATRLQEVAAQSDLLAQRTRKELSDAITELDHSSQTLADRLREGQEAALREFAATFGERSLAVVGKGLREQTEKAIAELDHAASEAGRAGLDTVTQLRARLAEVEEMAGNLETRIAATRDKAQDAPDKDFSIQMTQIIENLNSAAIDISKVFEADVSDQAWQAYLRGDYGVFTRKAVRILASRKADAVLAHYQADEGFKENVNRYVHEFESMLRVVLATRNGHMMAVTLLSSDVGKLYVALAQAIDRLRN